ncbi:hypothetical protein A2774_05100 [Candidatus Roizmanbacteria bacterium RIFCSPHIGHO2_01_FULL_39_12c]|uniref:Uncharacterized protein n=1 Tax=Candidatus Roizmanbacteria bacterium RIFCSPHIGHO2_01_FULL_39_12c TaxID=1802031 RepID=A0A1F7GDN5_9BACT|nr:MAG: hypothetical protein A2774_05100 [Candidatus Roizmanbacteria bacterium RIFCSPHIGHO2_01_FULL_39_12c]OGK48139.1 MAG: hypothetical protein A2963_04300 [Candidatus Roizmanbacteria bacterium RIFCSPLOWO2_01_FULL_40_13]
MRKNIQFVLYFFLTVISLAAFQIFRPFNYLDNASSYIVCDKNQARFEIGPNLIYSFTDSLDEFNDQKARKLCEYNLIKDYLNTLKVPEKPNYAFYPAYKTESSWLDALIISSILFFIGATVIQILFQQNQFLKILKEIFS